MYETEPCFLFAALTAVIVPEHRAARQIFGGLLRFRRFSVPDNKARKLLSDYQAILTPQSCKRWCARIVAGIGTDLNTAFGINAHPATVAE